MVRRTSRRVDSEELLLQRLSEVHTSVQGLHARLDGVTSRLEELERQGQHHRKRQSVHEYRHSSALARVSQTVAEVRGEVEGLTWATQGGPTISPGRRVLFVTSNGAGMGHLMRCLSIAQVLLTEHGLASTIVSMSRGIERLSNAVGADIDLGYLPSQDATGEPWEVWNRTFGQRMREVLDRVRPAVVVFDGAWVVRGLTEACRQRGVELVWVRRGLWKAGADLAQVENPGLVADLVIEPGDLSEEPAQWAGETADGAVRSAPVVHPRTGELPPEEARRALGLGSHRRWALVQLGQGHGPGALGSVREAAIRAARELGSDWSVAVAATDAGRADQAVDAAPLSPYYRAFGVVIAAAGYNTAHEVAASGVPLVLIPNPDTITDDQVRRAESFERAGYAWAVSRETELREAVFAAVDAGPAASPPAADGALELAALLSGRVDRAACDAHESSGAPSDLSFERPIFHRTDASTPS